MKKINVRLAPENKLPLCPHIIAGMEETPDSSGEYVEILKLSCKICKETWTIAIQVN